MGALHLGERSNHAGQALFVERLRAGLTVRALARKAGVMDKTIANAERGRSTLTDASLARLARALNVHPSDLLVGSAGQYRPTPWDSALRRRRHELHLTSLEAAARIGISRTTLLRAEAGSNIHRESAYKIARFYDLDILEVAPRLAQGAQYDGGTR